MLLGVDELYAGIPGDGPLKLEDVEHWLADPKNNEVLDFELPLGLAAGAARWWASTRIRSPGPRSNWAGSSISIRGSRPTARSVAPRATLRTKALPGTRSSASASAGRSAAAIRRSATTAFSAARSSGTAGPLARRSGHRPDRQSDRDGQHARGRAWRRIKKNPGLSELEFDNVFGELTIDTVAKAIARFERALVTGPSPFDYYEQLRPLANVDPMN